MANGKPRLVLSMRTELPVGLFDDALWDRLASAVDILDTTPLNDLDDPRADALLAQADIVLGSWGCLSLDARTLAKAPNLKLVAYAAGSVRWIVSDAFWLRAIVLTSAVRAMAVPVAEFTYAAIILTGKDAFRLGRRHMETRGAMRTDSRVSFDRPMMGNYARRIGIVGASNIGRRVIKMLVDSGYAVAVYDPFLSADDAAELGAKSMPLRDLMGWAHTVSLHAPILPETRHMIGAAELAAMPDGGWLINTARGWLLDHDALAAELATGRLNAFIDTPDPEPLPPQSPLYDMPNLFMTPHIAGAQGNELRRVCLSAIEEVERFIGGVPPLNPVAQSDMDRIA